MAGLGAAYLVSFDVTGYEDINCPTPTCRKPWPVVSVEPDSGVPSFGRYDDKPGPRTLAVAYCDDHGRFTGPAAQTSA
jgi:hypothetical protein